ncbi:Septin-type guanine nucleotide-binding (G) domain-containing protein, partial [Thamnocephalis sphaerospora]
TFLRTLNVSGVSAEEPAPTSRAFGQGPTTRINQVSMIVDEAGDRFGLTMVDTPGFVDDGTVEEQCRLLLTYLENQFDARLIEESRVKRNPKALHRQLHACLYFLDPSHAGLRPVDVIVIRNLSVRVNVIPVVAKADTLTIERMRRVKRAIREDIRTHRLRIYSFPDWEEEDDYESSEEGQSLPAQLSSTALRRLVPFSIMAMEEETLINEDEEPSDLFIGRRYPWGNILVMNPDHCDVSVLRTALLDTQRRVLRDTTVEDIYERYRTERM